MPESLQEIQARHQRELEAAQRQHESRMGKVMQRADAKVRKSIDQAAADIASASRELDGEDAVSEDDIKTALYAKYGITETSGGGETGSTDAASGADEAPPDGADDEAPPSDQLPAEGEPPANPQEEEPEPEPEPTPEQEPEPRDQRPPLAHWSEKPLFGRGRRDG